MIRLLLNADQLRELNASVKGWLAFEDILSVEGILKVC